MAVELLGNPQTGLDWDYIYNSGQFKNPSKFNWGNTMLGIGKSLAAPAIQMGGAALNKGAHNAVGDTLGMLSGAAAAIPVYGWAASAALAAASAVANGFTNTVNREHEKKVLGEINNLAGTTSNANDYAGLMSDYSEMLGLTVNIGDIDLWGSAGWLSSGSARRNARNNALNALDVAYQTRANNLNTRGEAINMLNTFNQLEHLSAFGGDLMTHGSDFSTNLILVNNGNTHELNPNNGVLMGIAPDGMPNLVEEGEVIWNDYVFSNRLKPSKKLKEKYKLNNDLSYADAIKKITKAEEERNDAISKDTREAKLAEFLQDLEDTRMAKLAREARKQLKNMSDEDILALQLLANLQLDAEQLMMMLQLMLLNPLGMFARGGYIHADGTPLVKVLPEVVVTPELNGIRRLSNIPPELLIHSRPNIKTKIYTKEPIPKELYETKPSITDLLLFNENYESARRKEKLMEYLMGESNYPIFAYGGKKGRMYAGPGYLDQLLSTIKFSNSNEGPLWVEEADPVDMKALKKDVARIQKKRNPQLPTWMRYAPIVGSAIGAGMSLFDKPDYSSADAIERASKITPNYINYKPIGDYLSYNPLDTNYALNFLRSSELANARNLINNSAGNAGVVRANLLANAYNSLLALANAYRQGVESNLALRFLIGTFNKATNMANSEGMMKADMANLAALMEADKLYATGVTTASLLRAAEDARIAANRNANFTGLFDNLGALGQENFNRNQLLMLLDSGWSGSISDALATLGGARRGNLPKANGGRIRKRKKGLTD